MNIDLTDVKESSFALIPNGEYSVMMDDCSIKETKSGTGEYINAKFRIMNGAYEGRWLFHMFNIKNENAKATEIGLGQLKTFMRCAGVKEFKLTDVLDLLSLKCNAVVKTRTDDYGEKNVISYFKPLADSITPATGTPPAGAVPF